MVDWRCNERTDLGLRALDFDSHQSRRSPSDKYELKSRPKPSVQSSTGQSQIQNSRQRFAPPIPTRRNQRGENIRVGSGFQGWLGTDLRIVSYGRSCTSKVVLR